MLTIGIVHRTYRSEERKYEKHKKKERDKLKGHLKSTKDRHQEIEKDIVRKKE